MKVYTEIGLDEFEPWSGAEETFEYLYDHDLLDELESQLEDIYPDGIEETELNDLFRFESETIYNWLGVETNEDGEPIDKDCEDD